MKNRSFNVSRAIAGYEKDPGSRLMIEFEFKKQISLKLLQEIFGEDEDNPMYDCYKIDQERADKLQQYIAEKIDLDQYDFFLECHELKETKV